MSIRSAALGTGAGRPHGRPKGVRHVEDVACPATLGSETHVLVNDARAVTRCLWCGRGWAKLDAEARGDVNRTVDQSMVEVRLDA